MFTLCCRRSCTAPYTPEWDILEETMTIATCKQLIKQKTWSHLLHPFAIQEEASRICFGITMQAFNNLNHQWDQSLSRRGIQRGRRRSSLLCCLRQHWQQIGQLMLQLMEGVQVPLSCRDYLSGGESFSWALQSCELFQVGVYVRTQ